MAASEDAVKLWVVIQRIGSVIKLEFIVALLFVYSAMEFAELSRYDMATESTIAVFLVGAMMCSGFAVVLFFQGVRD